MEAANQQILLRAIAHHQNGNFVEAEKLYRSILVDQPNHPDANHNLGVLAVSLNQTAVALPFLNRALRANATVPQFWLSYIDALIRAGDIAEARQSFDRGRNTLTIDQRIRIDAQLAAAGKIGRGKAAHRNHPDRIAEKRKNRIKSTGISIHPTTKPSPSEKDLLLASYAAGNFPEAETSGQDYTQKYPEDPFGWKFLSATCFRLGKIENALDTAKKAIDLAPDDAEAHNNIGVIFRDCARYAEARDAFSKAITLEPSSARYHYNIAILYQSMGEIGYAEKSYNRTIELDPQCSEAFNNLGILQMEQDKSDDALKSFRRATESNENNAEAFYNYSKALEKSGSLEEAEARCLRAINIKVNYTDAHKQLALIQKRQKRREEAEQTLKKAIAFDPEDPGLYYNLGNLLADTKRAPEAASLYRHAISLNPEFSEALCGLADLLFDQDRLTEAEYNYRRAIAANNLYPEPCNNIATLLLETGRATEAQSNYEKALKIRPLYPECFSNLLFAMNYLNEMSGPDILEKAKTFRNSLTFSPEYENSGDTQAEIKGRIRIGLISGDFRTHPVAFFLLSFLKALNRQKMVICAYANNDYEDATTARIKELCDEWSNISGLSDDDLADLIRKDGIAVAIDLSGHTAKNRLAAFARKPAPVQISWLGYCGTTGLKEIDYIFGDPHVTPESEEEHFVEKIWRFPETYWCFSAPESAPEIASPPVLANGYITFGCFNAVKKINDKVINVWARILDACPNAKLFLKTRQFSDRQVEQDFRRKLLSLGVDADRLIIEGHSSREDYFRTYNRVDIALDPFPFPGGTTSIEGLWMGVPFVTRKGNRFYSHNGETILHNIGLSDWIAEDDEAYIRKAIEFSKDRVVLERLRQGMRARLIASPLFDSERFARNFETAIFSILEKHVS